MGGATVHNLGSNLSLAVHGCGCDHLVLIRPAGCVVVFVLLPISELADDEGLSRYGRVQLCVIRFGKYPLTHHPPPRSLPGRRRHSFLVLEEIALEVPHRAVANNI
jgi:hypothetical protein